MDNNESSNRTVELDNALFFEKGSYSYDNVRIFMTQMPSENKNEEAISMSFVFPETMVRENRDDITEFVIQKINHLQKYMFHGNAIQYSNEDAPDLAKRVNKKISQDNRLNLN